MGSADTRGSASAPMPTDLTTWLLLFVVGAGVLALWLHRIDALRAVFKPAMDRAREDQIRDRTQALKHRAWSQDEHTDDRDLAARLQDSLYASGAEPLEIEDEMYLPGIGPMPKEWQDPDSKAPEARS